MKTEIKYRKPVNKSSKVVISNEVGDYGNDPYVIKKGEESKKFLEKHGFPEELLKKRREL